MTLVPEGFRIATMAVDLRGRNLAEGKVERQFVCLAILKQESLIAV